MCVCVCVCVRVNCMRASVRAVQLYVHACVCACVRAFFSSLLLQQLLPYCVCVGGKGNHMHRRRLEQMVQHHQALFKHVCARAGGRAGACEGV